MWIHMSNEMKWWKQCDGTEWEYGKYLWVMKWSDETVWWHWGWMHMNDDMSTAENVNEEMK